MLAHKLDLLQWASSFGFGDRMWTSPKESRILPSQMIFGKQADGRDEDVVLPSVWLMIAGSVSGVARAIFRGRPQ